MKPWRGTLMATAAMLLGAAIASDALAARNGGRSGAQGAGRAAGHAGGHAGGHAAHPGARGGRHPSGGRHAPQYRTGVYGGAPLFAPFYYYPPPPYYYYPAPIMAPAAPTYIEQYPGQSAPDPSSYWYYCASLNAYFPYVRDCPEGWQPVAPQPPS